MSLVVPTHGAGELPAVAGVVNWESSPCPSSKRLAWAGFGGF